MPCENQTLSQVDEPMMETKVSDLMKIYNQGPSLNSFWNYVEDEKDPDQEKSVLEKYKDNVPTAPRGAPEEKIDYGNPDRVQTIMSLLPTGLFY